uniref:Uncharacterized protein n=1 Tax=Romanomermis culicivorax TaxID=13658 RepID=A0A915L3R1_ROMCU
MSDLDKQKLELGSSLTKPRVKSPSYRDILIDIGRCRLCCKDCLRIDRYYLYYEWVIWSSYHVRFRNHVRSNRDRARCARCNRDHRTDLHLHHRGCCYGIRDASVHHLHHHGHQIRHHDHLYRQKKTKKFKIEIDWLRNGSRLL